VNFKAAVMFCAFAVTATPASAQMLGWGPYGAYPAEGVSPYSINVRLRANGLRQITQPVQTGRYIVVRAVDPYGSVVRVLFNAHYGNIVSIVPLPPAPIAGEGYGRPYEPYASREPYPRYGAPPADLKVEPAPPPNAMNAIPGAPEHRSAAVTPNRMPVPRPRPSAPVAAAPAAPPPAARSAVSAPPSNSATAAVKPMPEAAPPASTDPGPATTGSVGPGRAPQPSAKAPESFPPPASLE
jgi:hypothetical protein